MWFLWLFWYRFVGNSCKQESFLIIRFINIYGCVYFCLYSWPTMICIVLDNFDEIFLISSPQSSYFTAKYPKLGPNRVFIWKNNLKYCLFYFFFLNGEKLFENINCQEKLARKNIVSYHTPFTCFGKKISIILHSIWKNLVVF